MNTRYFKTPLYGFGHGLSLSTWSLQGDVPGCLDTLPAEGNSDDKCEVQLSLRNTGGLDGDSVVMAFWTYDDAPPPCTGAVAGNSNIIRLSARNSSKRQDNYAQIFGDSREYWWL